MYPRLLAFSIFSRTKMSKWGRVVTPQFLFVLFNRVDLIISIFILFYSWFLFGKYIIFFDVYVLSRFESVCGIFECRSILVFSHVRYFS